MRSLWSTMVHRERTCFSSTKNYRSTVSEGHMIFGVAYQGIYMNYTTVETDMGDPRFKRGFMLMRHCQEQQVNERFASLFDYEKAALLESLRRDARSELLKAYTNEHRAECHLANYHAIVRIIECLNPKRLKPIGEKRATDTAARVLVPAEAY